MNFFLGGERDGDDGCAGHLSSFTNRGTAFITELTIGYTINCLFDRLNPSIFVKQN